MSSWSYLTDHRLYFILHLWWGLLVCLLALDYIRGIYRRRQVHHCHYPTSTLWAMVQMIPNTCISWEGQDKSKQLDHAEDKREGKKANPKSHTLMVCFRAWLRQLIPYSKARDCLLQIGSGYPCPGAISPTLHQLWATTAPKTTLWEPLNLSWAAKIPQCHLWELSIQLYRFQGGDMLPWHWKSHLNQFSTPNAKKTHPN